MSHKTSAIDFDCVLAQGTLFNGNISFSKGVQVNGVLNGNVVARPGSASLLIIGNKATINGDVQATDIIVLGRLNGNIRSNGTVRLSNSARVTGNVQYNKLEIKNGAVIDGELTAGNSQVTDIKRHNNQVAS
jgi:cytoskeletal protein CcmA (bactofilin family)